MEPSPSEQQTVPLVDRRNAPEKRLFVTEDGRNVLFTFVLLVVLFALWGFCNGMIDVMDKHFQEELHLSLAAIRLGPVRALPGLLPDGAPGGVAGDPAGLQGGHHRGPLDRRGGRILVHPGNLHRLRSGRVLARGLYHRHRPHLPRDHRQSLHDRAGADRIRGDPDQSRPILQRHRPAPGTDRRRHLLLFQERRGEEHGQPSRCGSLTPRSGPSSSSSP